MRVFNFLLAVMFMAFAFLQVNDPDPVVWILIYGAMAVLSILAIFNIYPKHIILIMLVGYIGFSVIFIPGIQEWFQQEDKTELFDNLAKMKHSYIEESREFLGLWICAAVLIFYYSKARAQKP